ncbi:hypothetical protein HUJ04_001484 [Dendroctonus ponderosae]|nr:hypothetical protein HUJ04_001484 [Dendroctonus ponderosae]
MYYTYLIDIFARREFQVRGQTSDSKTVPRRPGPAFVKISELPPLPPHSLPTKIRLLKCYVFPQLLYGVESSTLTKVSCKKLKFFETWLLKRILRIPGTVHIINDSVLEQICKEKELNSIKTLKLEYLRHIMRKSQRYQLLQLILQGNVFKDYLLIGIVVLWILLRVFCFSIVTVSHLCDELTKFLIIRVRRSPEIKETTSRDIQRVTSLQNSRYFTSPLGHDSSQTNSILKSESLWEEVELRIPTSIISEQTCTNEYNFRNLEKPANWCLNKCWQCSVWTMCSLHLLE